jgi:uncharacterized membrane protein YhaH (DUF805 family)
MNADLVSLLFTFQGRINRAKYWLAVVVYLAIMIVIVALAFLLAFGMLFFVTGGIIYLGMLISGIAVGIKRLHDRDKSGWWLLLFYLLPGVLGGIGSALDMETIFALAGGAISIWMIVELGFLRGTSGPNQYGPDPLAGQ